MIKPYGDCVLLKLEDRERKTRGGLFIPDTAESEYGDGLATAVVMRVGPGMYGRNAAYDEQTNMSKLDWLSSREYVPNLHEKRERIREKQKLHEFPMDVVPGDRALIDKNAGDPLVVGDNVPHRLAEEFEAGDELRIVRCAEIMAVLENEDGTH